jgi:hypothetical protein
VCDTDTVQVSCLNSGMILNTGKTAVVSFTCETNSINFNNNLYSKLVACSQHVKDLGIMLDCKLYCNSTFCHKA